MIKVVEYPGEQEWRELLRRPVFDVTSLFDTVRGIMDSVAAEGDAALYAFAEKFDKVKLSSLQATHEEIEASAGQLSDHLKAAIRLAHANIEAFHRAQIFTPIEVQTCPGVRCIQRSVPIEKVGLYIPGGSAPLFSTVLMLATPAAISGCGEIVLCTPPAKDGSVHPAILYAASVAGVKKVFKVGGAQAIAAMSVGTESVPRVDKIFGPGNQYVTAAKQLATLSGTAIDMPAGPSEVEVIADETSNAAFVAADLLSQAEHGADSQSVLVTTSREMLERVKGEIAMQLQGLPRRELAEKSLAHSLLILVRDKDEAMRITNAYAPEHLIISTDDYAELAPRVVNAGSVFLGKYSCESAGDYASGTNHTLPTNGYARAYSGLNLDSFNKKITFQELTAEGIASIGRAVEDMAEAEQLHAHKHAMTLRINSIEQR